MSPSQNEGSEYKITLVSGSEMAAAQAEGRQPEGLVATGQEEEVGTGQELVHRGVLPKEERLLLHTQLLGPVLGHGRGQGATPVRPSRGPRADQHHVHRRDNRIRRHPDAAIVSTPMSAGSSSAAKTKIRTLVHTWLLLDFFGEARRTGSFTQSLQEIYGTAATLVRKDRVQHTFIRSVTGRIVLPTSSVLA